MGKGTKESNIRHEVSLKLIAETDLAWKVTEGVEDKEGEPVEFWLPKSRVNCDHEGQMFPGTVYVFEVPEWLIEKTGITL